MCGIVGYIGAKNAVPVLINGLRKLEYRGYDSAGIAINIDGEISCVKTKGRLANLEKKILVEKTPESSIGIGHTRWATHGEPSDVNSHPHVSSNNKIAVVHNGIIENYIELKEMLVEQGYTFLSETDTEVIANLIDYHYNGDLLDTVSRAIKDLQGSFALAVLSSEDTEEFIAVRRESPLIVGLGINENFVASDIPAILEHTRKIYLLNNEELVRVRKDGVTVYDSKKRVLKKEITRVEWDVEAAEKGGYEHFMLKEMNEQPKVIHDTISPRIRNGLVEFEDFSLTKTELARITRTFIIGCGTAYHAGVVGKYLIEDMAKIPVEVDIASEFRYRNPIIDKNTLVIIISQSGETADTLAVLREVRAKGARVLAIVNVRGSSIAREADDVIYTWAGPEIAVASTKAYTGQLAVMYLIAAYFATLKETITEKEIKKLLQELTEIPEKVKNILEKIDDIKKLGIKYCKESDMFFLGRGKDYVVAMEGSLKLKEIAYIHSEAYAAGELKHGPIALIEQGTVVFAIVTQDELSDKMLSNIKEVKARGASVIAIAKEGNRKIKHVADHVFYIPKIDDRLSSILTVVPLQLFAYFCAIMKGCDVDKPRNLAKSVTVE